jgi:hypothetical protein
MASVYELAIQTSAVGAAAPSLEICAITKPASILEIEIANSAATAASLTIGRPGNTPTTGTQVTATLPTNRPPGGQVSTTNLIIAGWGTAPTVPAAGNSHRRVGLPATIGAGWLGVWAPREMILDPTRSGSLIIWNVSTTGVLNVRVKWEE